jgi:hypothetical protein
VRSRSAEPAIEVSEEQLIISVPPRKLWLMLVGRGALLVFAVAVFLAVVPTVVQTRARLTELVCPVSALILVLLCACAALSALLRAIRFGQRPATVAVSSDGLSISNPAFDNVCMRRWRREEISYVLVERSTITASLGLMINVSIITSDGDKDSGLDITTRDGSLHRKLEQMINTRLGITPRLRDD